MNISLNSEFQQLIQKKIDSGMYHSASEVIREALRLMKEHDLLREHKLRELKKDIQIGLDQADRGESTPLDFEELKKEIKKHYAKRKKAA